MDEFRHLSILGELERLSVSISDSMRNVRSLEHQYRKLKRQWRTVQDTDEVKTLTKGKLHCTLQ